MSAAIDFALEYAIVVGVAWAVTRSSTPRHARWAGWIWLLTAAFPLFWWAGAQVLAPSYIVRPRPGLLPAFPGWPSSWQITLLASYAVVSSALLARAGIAWHHARRLRHQARRVEGTELDRLRDVVHDVRLDVREADVVAPLVTGILQPVIVLPMEWRQFTGEELRVALFHEHAHITRRDLLMSFGCLMLEAALWWHPGVWVTSNRLRWFAELACDHRAAARMNEGAYATTLLKLAARWSGVRYRSYALSAATTMIARRISLLIDDASATPRRQWKVLMTVVVVGVICSGALVAFQPARNPVPSVADHLSDHRQQHTAGHRHH